MTLKFCGFNGFQQFQDCKDIRVARPTDFKIPHVTEVSNKLVQFLWSLNIYAYNKTLIISGFHDGCSHQIKKLDLEDNIKQICCNEKICLILLESDKLFKYDVLKKQLDEVVVQLEFNPSVKRSIFGEHLNKRSMKLNTVTHIACSTFAFVSIMSDGSVYCLTNKIFQFPSHIKVRDLTSGFEHFLLLSNNGDVHSWGNGSRGQLGHNELDAFDYPKIIDALAGIKIIFISAGGWHSAAISAFGDLYVWGSNVNGQLGISHRKIDISGSQKVFHMNPTVYPLPEIIDVFCGCSENYEITNCSVTKVICGARHTIIQMRCGRIYGTGWNAHNQLGILKELKKLEIGQENDDVVDKFLLINIDYSQVDDILCGHWCTIFKNKKSEIQQQNLVRVPNI